MECGLITELVREHKRGVSRFKEIAQALFPLLTEKARCYARRYGIERNEILSEFMFKLPKLIERFDVEGGVFEHYVLASLKWFSRDMKRDELLGRSNDAFLFHESEKDIRSMDHQQAFQEEEEYSMRLPKSYFNESSLKQRLVILLLKSALHVTDAHIEKVAAFTGISQGFLRHAVTLLNERLYSRKERRDYLLGNKRWVDRRMLYLRSKLSMEYDEPERSIILAKLTKLEEKRARLDSQIKGLPDGPSHDEIARILGIPRGSVDSSLYYIKSQYKHVFDAGA